MFNVKKVADLDSTLCNNFIYLTHLKYIIDLFFVCFFLKGLWSSDRSLPLIEFYGDGAVGRIKSFVFTRQLSYVKERCDREPEGDGVPALTSDERTRWAKVGRITLEEGIIKVVLFWRYLKC